MLKGVLSYVLQGFIGKYVEGFNKDQVSLGLYSGNLTLENLSLKREALQDLLDLPIQVKSGYVRSITVQIPYTQLNSQPWNFKIVGVYVVVGRSSDTTEAMQSKSRREHIKKFQTLESMERRWLEHTYAESSESYKGFGASLLSYGSSLTHNILHNIQIELHDIHIRYEDDVTIPGMAFAVGLRIEHLSTRSTDAHWNVINSVTPPGECAFKLLDAKGISIYYVPNSPILQAFDKISLLQHFETVSQVMKTTETVYILKPISFTGYLKRYLTSHALKDRGKARLHLDLFINEVTICYMEPLHWVTCSFLNEMERLQRLKRNAAIRPKESIFGNAPEWWRYACTCTWRQLDQFSRPLLMSRVRYVTRYIRSYEKHLLRLEHKTHEDVLWRATVEKDWSLEEILALRQVAMDRASIQMKSMKTFSTSSADVGNNKADYPRSGYAQSWYQWWWSSDTTTSAVESIVEASATEDEKALGVVIPTIAETEAALEELSLLEENVDHIMMKDEVFLRVRSVLKGVKVTLYTQENEELLTIDAQGFTACAETRPRHSSALISASMQSLCVKASSCCDSISTSPYIKILSGLPNLYDKTTSESEPLFAFLFELHPLDSSEDYKVRVHLEPVNIIYNSVLIGKLKQFFTNAHKTYSFSASTNIRYRNLKEQTKRNFRHILNHLGRKYRVDSQSMHSFMGDEENYNASSKDLTDSQSNIASGFSTHWDVQMNVCAPKIMFLDSNVFTVNNNVLLLDLGRLEVSTVKVPFQNAQDSSSFEQDWKHMCDTFALTNVEENDVSTNVNNVLLLPESVYSDDDNDEFMTPCASPVHELEELVDENVQIVTSVPSPSTDTASVFQSDVVKQLENVALDRVYERYLIRLVDLQVLVGPLADVKEVVHLDSFTEVLDDQDSAQSTHEVPVLSKSLWPIFSRTRLFHSLNLIDKFSLSIRIWRRLVAGNISDQAAVILRSDMPKFLVQLSDTKMLLMQQCLANISTAKYHSKDPTKQNEKSEFVKKDDEETCLPSNSHSLPRARPFSNKRFRLSTGTAPSSFHQVIDSQSSYKLSQMLLKATFDLDEFVVQLESRGRPLVELKLQGTEAIWKQYDRYTELDINVCRGLTVADAIANLGPDYDLLIASHNNIRLDSLSGCLNVSEAGRSSSSLSERQISENSDGPPKDESESDSDSSVIQFHYRRAVEIVETPNAYVQILKKKHEAMSVIFNSVDVIGNQGTIVELVHFFQRVLPQTKSSKPHVSSPASPVSEPAIYEAFRMHHETTQIEAKLFFNHINLLLIHMVQTEQGSTAKKLGALTLNECSFECLKEDDTDTLLVHFRIHSLLLLDLTSQCNHPHSCVLSVGDVSQYHDMNHMEYQSYPHSHTHNIMDDNEREALYISLFITHEEHEPTNIDISSHLSHNIFYTHSPRFLAYLSHCLDSMLRHYLSLAVTRIQTQAAEQAHGLCTTNTVINIQCELETPVIVLPRCTWTPELINYSRRGEVLVGHLGRISLQAEDVTKMGLSLRFSRCCIFARDLCNDSRKETSLADLWNNSTLKVHDLSDLVKGAMILQKLYLSPAHNKEDQSFILLEDTSLQINITRVSPYSKTHANTHLLHHVPGETWAIEAFILESLRLRLSKNVYEQVMSSLDNLVYSLEKDFMSTYLHWSSTEEDNPPSTNESDSTSDSPISTPVSIEEFPSGEEPENGASVKFLLPGVAVTLFSDLREQDEPLARLELRKFSLHMEMLFVAKLKQIEVSLESIKLEDLLTKNQEKVKTKSSTPTILLHSAFYDPSSFSGETSGDFDMNPSESLHKLYTSCPHLMSMSRSTENKPVEMPFGESMSFYHDIDNISEEEDKDEYGIPISTGHILQNFEEYPEWTYSTSLPERSIQPPVPPVIRKKTKSVVCATPPPTPRRIHKAASLSKLSHNLPNDFVKISLTLMDEASPLFIEQYASTHRFININFSSLHCNLDLSAWLLILDFLSLISRMHDMEEVKEMPDVSRVAKEYARKPDGQKENLINSEIHFSVASFVLTLIQTDLSMQTESSNPLRTEIRSQKDGPFARITMNSFHTFLSLRDGNFECDGSIQAIELHCSGEEATSDIGIPYPQRLLSTAVSSTSVPLQSFQNEELFSSESFGTFRPLQRVQPRIPHLHPRLVSMQSTHNISNDRCKYLFRWYLFKYGMPDPGLKRSNDMSFQLRLAPLYYIHTQFFLQEILLFTHNFTQLMDMLGRARACSAGMPVPDKAPRASRISLDVQARAPVLLVPQSFASDRLLALDLGYLSVTNVFHFSDKSCPHIGIISIDSDGDEKPTISEKPSSATPSRQPSILGNVIHASDHLRSNTVHSSLTNLSGRTLLFPSSTLKASVLGNFLIRSPSPGPPKSPQLSDSSQMLSMSTSDEPNSACLLDCMKVTLSDIFVYTARRISIPIGGSVSTSHSLLFRHRRRSRRSDHTPIDTDGVTNARETYSNEDDELILEPIIFNHFMIVPDTGHQPCRSHFQLTLRVERNLDGERSHVAPDMKVRGQLSRVAFFLDVEQYQFIKSLLEQNLGADVDQLMARKVFAHPQDPTLQTILTGKKWCNVDFRIELKNVSIELLHSAESSGGGGPTSSMNLPLKTLKSFCRFDFILSRLDYKSYSDKSKMIHLSCSKVNLRDTRFKKTSSSLSTNAFPIIVRSVDDKTRKTTSGLEHLGIRFNATPKASQFSIQLNNMRVLMIFDWLKLTQQFLTAPCLPDERRLYNDMNRRVSTGDFSAGKSFTGQSSSDNEQQRKEFVFAVSDTEFVCLETPNNLHSNAVVLRGTLTLRHKPWDSESLSCFITGLQMYSCVISSEASTTLYILDPTNISLCVEHTQPEKLPWMTHKHGSGRSGATTSSLMTGDSKDESPLPMLQVNIGQIMVRFSYNDFRLFRAILCSLISQQQNSSSAVSQDTKEQSDHIPWWLKLKEKFSRIKLKCPDESTSQIIARIIDDCLDADIPLVDIVIRDIVFDWWLGQHMIGTLRANLFTNYYNRVLLAWEPLLESWIFQCVWKYGLEKDGQNKWKLGLLSNNRINFNITPHLIELLSTTLRKWSAEMSQNVGATDTTNSNTPVVEENYSSFQEGEPAEDYRPLGGILSHASLSLPEGDWKNFGDFSDTEDVDENEPIESQAKRRQPFVPFCILNLTGVPLAFHVISTLGEEYESSVMKMNATSTYAPEDTQMKLEDRPFASWSIVDQDEIYSVDNDLSQLESCHFSSDFVQQYDNNVTLEMHHCALEEYPGTSGHSGYSRSEYGDDMDWEDVCLPSTYHRGTPTFNTVATLLPPRRRSSDLTRTSSAPYSGTSSSWVCVAPMQKQEVVFPSAEHLSRQPLGDCNHSGLEAMSEHRLRLWVKGWKPIQQPITVDRLGCLYRDMKPSKKTSSEFNERANRIVIELCQQGTAQKLIIVRSAIQISNQLQDRVELKLDSGHRASVSIFMEPGDTLAVPLSHIFSRCYARPVGQRWALGFATKHLDWSSVNKPGDSKEFLLRCSSSRDSSMDHSFTHLSMSYVNANISSKESYYISVKVQRQWLSTADVHQLPGHKITLSAPLTFINLLPYDLCFVLHMSKDQSTTNMPTPTLVHTSTHNCPPSQVKFTLKMGDEQTVHWVPGSCNLNLRISVAEMFPFSEEVLLPASTSSYSIDVGVFDSRRRRLNIKLQLASMGEHSSRITALAPFWLINRSSLPLVFSNRNSTQSGVASIAYASASDPDTHYVNPGTNFNAASDDCEEAAGQFEEHEMAQSLTPLLFSCMDPHDIPTLRVRLGAKYCIARALHSDTRRAEEVPVWSHKLLLSRTGVDTIQLRMKVRENRPDYIYNIGVEVRKGRGRYMDTTVVVFRPRFMLENRSSFGLTFAQSCLIQDENNVKRTFSSGVYTAYPQCCLPYHWSRQDLDLLLCTRIVPCPASDSMTSEDMTCVKTYWSGGFRIDEPTSFHLILRTQAGRNYFLRVSIVLQGSTFVVVFSDIGSRPLPYLIDNRSPVSLVIYQAEADSLPYRRTLLRPFGCVDYALDEPTLPAKICVSVQGGSSATYDLTDNNDGIDLRYENYFYICLEWPQSKSSAVNNSPQHLLSVQDDSTGLAFQPIVPGFSSMSLENTTDIMVLDVMPGSKKVILSHLCPGKRSQLWWCDPNSDGGLIYHEGSSPPRDPTWMLTSSESHYQETPSSKRLVLGVEAMAPEPPDSLARRSLRLERYDSRRAKLQHWNFTKDQQLMNRAGMLVQVNHIVEVFCALPPSREIASSSVSKTISRPLSTRTFQKWMRPGSGRLQVRIFNNGPVRVLRIEEDGHAKEVLRQRSEGGWLCVEEALPVHIKRKESHHPDNDNNNDKYHNIPIILHILLSNGFGISLMNNTPEEMLYITASAILARCDRQGDREWIAMSIGTLQVDNQMLDSSLPIVLYPTIHQGSHEFGMKAIAAPSASVPIERYLLMKTETLLNTFEWNIFDSRLAHDVNNQAFLSLRWERMLRSQWAAKVFSFFQVRMSDFHLVLEERLLLKAIQLYNQLLPYLSSDNKSGSSLSKQVIDEEEEENYRFPAAATFHEGTYYYFGQLKLTTGTITLSVNRNSTIPDELKQWKRSVASIISFANAPVTMDAFTAQHFFVTQRLLFRELESHYLIQLRKQALQIFGSTDFLGNPLGLYTEIKEGISGLYDFDVSGLVRNVTHGVSNSTAKMFGNMSHVMHFLTLDKDHQEQRARMLEDASKRGGIAHLSAGFSGLREGVVGGISSIFYQPYQGFMSQGVPGLVVGVGKGMVGTVTKPLGGVLDFLTGAVSSIREVARSSAEGRPPRVRPSRVCVKNCPLRTYHIIQAEGQSILLYLSQHSRTTAKVGSSLPLDTAASPWDCREKLHERITILQSHQESVDALITDCSVLFVRIHGRQESLTPSHVFDERECRVSVIVEIPYSKLAAVGWHRRVSSHNWYIYFHLCKVPCSSSSSVQHSPETQLRCETESIAKSVAYSIYNAWYHFQEAGLTVSQHS